MQFTVSYGIKVNLDWSGAEVFHAIDNKENFFLWFFSFQISSLMTCSLNMLQQESQPPKLPSSIPNMAKFKNHHVFFKGKTMDSNGSCCIVILVYPLWCSWLGGPWHHGSLWYDSWMGETHSNRVWTQTKAMKFEFPLKKHEETIPSPQKNEQVTWKGTISKGK